ncbi:hypothetical protein [Marinobacter alkaliphilus]|uniref:DUF3168 domain-containing protein n=1 Tax=Marinobacter alkaliphilus TaxID=254719 RepID=A0ABZ3E917_9GAMM
MDRLQKVLSRGIEPEIGFHVVLNAPEFFERKDFVDYIEREPVFTWHRPGKLPGDYADVVVLVEPSLNGEGTESDLPDDIWNTVLGVLRQSFGDNGERLPAFARSRHIAVRLTNIEVD